jgi:uncharacterized protein YyaL (SSP411 family)
MAEPEAHPEAHPEARPEPAIPDADNPEPDPHALPAPRRVGRANRLAGETSPYLCQHADNPVDWYPWGPEALEVARRDRKPIHLSIGYAACHWCHVLARESFEDPATARLLNEQFVNIKVDREERPDLDRIYQTAHQMLTHNGGGWPLTMFLAPDDQRPFFGGTYFPKEAAFGLPPFRTVLERVARYYREHETQWRAQNAALVRAFGELDPALTPAGATLDDTPLRAGRAAAAASFDREFGGARGRPKFPQPARLERLLRDWHSTAFEREPDLEALFMATLTLTRMGDGGLFDQLGGGFSRYSVDEFWMIPHFEKMLCDNGALLAVYADAALATGDARFAQVANETADWMLREMRAPSGGFCSSLDADSDGQEGTFYLWDRAQIERSLTPAEWAVFGPHFGLDREPNFEGRWHLYRAQPLAAAESNAGDAARRIDSARAKLLALRELRTRPGRDEKILTSWNALAIRGLARAARALERPDLEQAATRALDQLRDSVWRDGRLLAASRNGRAHLNAYLDDYVFLANAVLELLQLRWRSTDLEWLRSLLETVLGHFEDPAGGFFFTSDDHETLIHRGKSLADEATPAGNGVAALVLQRAGYLLGESRYLAAAERTLRAAWSGLEQHPEGHATLLTALEEYLNPPQIVILRGEAAEIARWGAALGRLYAPRRLVFAIPADAPLLPEALASKPPRFPAVAYVCRGTMCEAPVPTLEALVRNLRLNLEPPRPASQAPLTTRK